MKVWLDVLTPKQVNFFAELQRRLNARGFKTFLTTREYREVNELLQLRGVKAERVGRHGGGLIRDKLVESANRIVALVRLIEEQEPDVAISFSSPEAARVAFGLKIPHYCVSDSPHAEAVCRLTIPLSKKLFTPWVIPSYAWKKYGIQPRDIVHYRALDPAVWLDSPKGNSKVPESLHLDPSKPTVVLRTPEEHAAYLSERSNTSIGTEIVAKILDLDKDGLQIVVLPRYNDQTERFKKRFGNRIVLPEHVVDAVSLIRFASVFVGGGGTMSAEAALLGVPVISYYPGEPTFIERFLIKYGLVERLLDPGRVAQRALSICRSHDFSEFYRKKSIRLLRSMEDPLRVIMRRIFKR